MPCGRADPSASVSAKAQVLPRGTKAGKLYVLFTIYILTSQIFPQRFRQKIVLRSKNILEKEGKTEDNSVGDFAGVVGDHLLKSETDGSAVIGQIQQKCG